MTELPQLPGNNTSGKIVTANKNAASSKITNEPTPEPIKVNVDNQNIGQSEESNLTKVVKAVKDAELQEASNVMVNLHTRNLHQLAKLNRELTEATLAMVRGDNDE